MSLKKNLVTALSGRAKRTEPEDAPATADAPDLGRLDSDRHLLTPAEIADWDRWALERRVRELSRSVYLGAGVALCRVLGRYKMYVDTKDVGFASHLLLDGIWEPWITQFFARSARPGMTVVDIGANFGYYTLLAADIVGEAGCVIAVEPNPAACSLLRKSVAVNGFSRRVEVIAAAAGAVDADDAVLFVPDGEPKNARLVAPSERGGDGMLIVARRRMDSLLAGRLRVDIVKIDVEGAEEEAIGGLLTTLTGRRPLVILEFNAARCRAPRELLERLRQIYPEIMRCRVDGGEDALDNDQLLQPPASEDQILILRPGSSR